MKILIGWLIASALELLLWQPFGQAAKRGDEEEKMTETEPIYIEDEHPFSGLLEED